MANEKIEVIKELMKQRKTFDTLKLLNELEKDLGEIETLKEFSQEIKRLVRNSGRSNMISISEIEELIARFKIK